MLWDNESVERLVLMTQEMQLVEWKSNWRDEWLQWIAGYANAQGGVLEVGKNDSGEVVGLSNSKKLLEDIPNKIKQYLGIVADVDLKFQDEKPYIAITVQPYSFPTSYHGRYYYRSGSTKQELTGRALDEYLLGRMGKTWDGAPTPLVKFEDLDEESFAVFRKKLLAVVG